MERNRRSARAGAIRSVRDLQIPAELRRYSALERPFVPEAPTTTDAAETSGSASAAGRDLLGFYRTCLPFILEAGGFRMGGRAASLRMQRMLQATEWGGRGPALDLGCGVGTSADIVAKVARPVVLLDAVLDQLAAARGGSRVSGDGRLLPFSRSSLGLVWSEDVFSHISSRRMLLADCGRVLRPGGSLVFFDLVRGASLTATQETRFRWAWCLAPLETAFSYLPLLDTAGFDVLAFEIVGKELLRLQEADEMRRGDAASSVYIEWLVRNRRQVRAAFGNLAVSAHLERLRTYSYLFRGQLDYIMAVCRRR
jgi:SAM-dependent methyltransferase